MRRVLVLAYHFPPMGGAGVQRSTKFVRYLPECGYEAVVVASPAPAAGGSGPVDAALAEDLPAGLRVRRVPGPEPPISSGWRRRAERWLCLPSPYGRWWRLGAGRAGRAAGREAGVDLVYASIMPFETGAAGVAVARRLGVPLVLDLRDPWALDELRLYPSALNRWVETSQMRRVLRGAAAIVMNTEEAARRARARFPELGDRPLRAIRNGFDEADFRDPPPPRADGRFRIVHTGLFLTPLGLDHARGRFTTRFLGGGDTELNVLGRSPVYLFRALDRLIAAEPHLRDLIEVHLAGVLTEPDRELVRRTSATVVVHPYLPHPESIALVRSADLLFLPMHAPRPGMLSSSMPGKTFEYMRSGRPILAAVPGGDARDLLRAGRTALFADPADADAMARIIRREIDRVRAGVPAPVADPDLLARFERRALTGELAALFDRVLGSGPAARGATRAPSGVESSASEPPVVDLRP